MQLNVEIDEEQIRLGAISMAAKTMSNLVEQQMRSFAMEELTKQLIREELAKQVPIVVAEYLSNPDEVKQLINRSLKHRIDRMIKTMTEGE